MLLAREFSATTACAGFLGPVPAIHRRALRCASCMFVLRVYSYMGTPRPNHAGMFMCHVSGSRTLLERVLIYSIGSAASTHAHTLSMKMGKCSDARGVVVKVRFKCQSFVFFFQPLMKAQYVHVAIMTSSLTHAINNYGRNAAPCVQCSFTSS